MGFVSYPRASCKSCCERFVSFVKRALKHVKFNFITIHYIYIISWALVGSAMIYPRGGLDYIDALFFTTGAATQSGLNTIDLNLLHTYQQVFLYAIPLVTTPIFIHSSVVFVRLYWFEKRFQHIARNARSLRRSKSRTSIPREEQNVVEERLSFSDQPIVMLSDDDGEAQTRARQDHLKPESSLETGESNERDSTLAIGPDGAELLGRSRAEDAVLALEGLRLPSPLSPEQHIAFLENQRKITGALRIPSPREYDRGGTPLAVENGGETTRTEVDDAPHITINEPTTLPARTGGPTLPRTDSQGTMPDERDDDESVHLSPIRSRRLSLNMLVRSLTEERERDTLPYLGWNATIGRNSAFANLTADQREELGGIEYRSLKTLAALLCGYYFFFHILGVLCLVPWILNSSTYGPVVTSDGQGRPWWGIFTSASAFNDVGYTLTPDSMNSFQRAIFPLLFMSFLVVIGNTGFPCMLRFTIWMLAIVVRTGTPLWEELQFLLDHPRRCFTLLFPRNATWWLFAILVILNGVDLIFFTILDVSGPSIFSVMGEAFWLTSLASSVIRSLPLSLPVSGPWMASSRLCRREPRASELSILPRFTLPSKCPI
jgi:Cation transport protein